jgi:hypothetical protein
LTQSATSRRNYASFTNFAAFRKTAHTPRRTDLAPEAEDVTGEQNYTMKFLACDPKVLDLS